MHFQSFLNQEISQVVQISSQHKNIHIVVNILTADDLAMQGAVGCNYLSMP